MTVSKAEAATDPMELVGRLEEWAKEIALDGTPSQIGPSPSELTEAAACIREMVEWRPIGSYSPELYPRLVDLWGEGPGPDGDNDRYRIPNCWRRSDGVWVSLDFGEIRTTRITHWRPLPLPPAPGAEA